MISKWINEIREFSPEEFVFYGDSSEDLEESSSQASEQVCFDYIKYCDKQVELTKKYLYSKLYGILHYEISHNNIEDEDHDSYDKLVKYIINGYFGKDDFLLMLEDKYKEIISYVR
jgi:hypothetical protein